MQLSVNVGFRRVTLPVLILIACFPACPQPSSTLPNATEIDLILRQLADITGFKIHHQLPFALVTREQVNTFLKQQIQQTVKPDDLRAEEITLKKFGFVAPDFDLRQNTIDLLTEQAAAYYDFHRKKLFISDWASHNMRDEALVHELSHALADQNFSISRFLKDVSRDNEAALARDSVVEGQATWLMIEYAARRSGRTLGDPDTARDLLRPPSDAEDPAYPVFSKAPLYIRTTLMFPYEEGERFQQSLYERNGKASFAAVFTRPPSTTAQILHTERYFTNVQPVIPRLPKNAAHTKPYIAGNMGELDHRILLHQFIDQQTSEDLSQHLSGAAWRIDEEKSTHRMTLTYASQWDTDAAAERFFAAYRQVLTRKWKAISVAQELPTTISGKGDDGYFQLRREGANVTSLEGFEQPFALN